MGNLVLIVEHDREARRGLRRRLEVKGYEVVEAGSVTAALELLQLVPHGFRAVLIQLDLPDLPGMVLVETLRLFRPDLPVFCLPVGQASAAVAGCAQLPDGPGGLELDLPPSDSGGAHRIDPSRLPLDAVQRARARYLRTADLLEAAQEVAKGLPPR